MDTFRPFITNDSQLHTFSASNSTPESVCRASLKQLKYIVQRHAPCFLSQACIILRQSSYLYVANAMLNDSHDPERFSYFLFCLRGYIHLSRSFQIAKITALGLLSMALSRGFLSGTKCSALVDQLRTPEGHPHDQTSERPRAMFMVDLDLALKNPGAATASELADRLDYLVLFDCFTTGENLDPTGAG